MKKGTGKHPKTIRLAQKLGINRVHARGILGELWEWVGEYYSDGNISDTTAVEIAEAVNWHDRSDQLVEALIATRWLDGKLGDRLVVHDWDDHCAEWVKKRRTRLWKRSVRTTSGHCPDGGETTADMGAEQGRAKQGRAKLSLLKGESTRGGKRKHVEPVREGELLTMCGEALPGWLQSTKSSTALIEWFKYKRERREHYAPTGAKALVTKLSKWGPVRTVAAIEHSMANNWAGIHEPDDSKPGAKGRAYKYGDLPEDVPEYLRDT